MMTWEHNLSNHEMCFIVIATRKFDLVKTTMYLIRSRASVTKTIIYTNSIHSCKELRFINFFANFLQAIDIIITLIYGITICSVRLNFCFVFMVF